jgi:type IV fimbrial biogenesis protein FimT
MSNRTLHRTRGFTLIEMMVVLTVSALLLFAVLPSFTAWLRDLRIRGVAESLQNGLQLARMEALRRNEVVSLWLVSDADAADCSASSSSASWVVSAANPATACGSTTVVDKQGRAATATGVAVASVQTTTDGAAGNASRIAFNGFGQLVLPGSATPLRQVVISLTHANADARPLRVEVLPGGSIRMCDPNVASDDPRRCML